MGTTYHLSFVPADRELSDPDDSLSLRAALRRDGEADSCSRILITRAWQDRCLQFAKGCMGSIDGTSLQLENDVLLLLGHGNHLVPSQTRSPFASILQEMINASGARLVVHLHTPGCQPSGATLTEKHLAVLTAVPWEALHCNGHLRVVRSLHEKLRAALHQSTARDEVGEVHPALRLLLVLGPVHQEQHQSNVGYQPGKVLQTLRDAIVAAQQANPELRIHLRCVAAQPVSSQIFETGLGIHSVDDKNQLRQVIRGEHAICQDQAWDVVHWYGHTNAAPSSQATGLLCGFHAADAIPPAQTPATDLLTGEELASDLASPKASRRTVLCVFDGCAIRERFLLPVLDWIDHAIGSLGLVDAEASAQWIPAFYREIWGWRPVGAAIQQGRRALPDRSWQLLHFTASDKDEPWAAPEDLARAEYVGKLRDRLKELEGDFGEFELTAVTIPLQIERIAEGAPGVGEQEWESDQRPFHRLLREDRAPALPAILQQAPRQRFLLLGEPGGGKTTTLRQQALLTLKDQEALPIYVRLPDWMKSATSSTLDDLISFALRDLGQQRVTPLRRWLQVEERIVLLLDGWDELQPEDIPKARDLVTELATHDLRNVVIACRFAARPKPMPKVHKLSVLRLDRNGQIDLLTNWFVERFRQLSNDELDYRVRKNASQRAGQIVDLLEEQPGSLRQIASIPLFLSLLARMVTSQTQVFQATPSIDLRQLLQRIHRRHQFFEEAFDFLLKGLHRRDPESSVTPDDLTRWKKLLGSVGFAFCRQATTEMEYLKVLDLLHEETAQPETLLARFSRCGILRPVRRSESQGRWTFFHRSFQEAFAARHLACKDVLPLATQAQERDRRRTQAVEAIADDDPAGQPSQKADDEQSRVDEEDPTRFWVQPFALAAGYLGEAVTVVERVKAVSEWLRWLTGHPSYRAIGLGALAVVDSDHLEQNLLHDVLWENRDLDWRQRKPVYRNLEPPFGRGADVIDELLAFAAHERADGGWRLDRSELYSIDWVLEQLEKDSHMRSKAQTARRALLGMIGVQELPAEWVQRLTVGIPQSVEEGRTSESYWRYIPAGYGWVGSPEGEANGDSYEGPRTKLHVKQPFWLAEVPVTFGLYRLFDPGHEHNWGTGEDVPVTEVDWYAATMFGRWLQARLAQQCPTTGLAQNADIRLPTEWEWEYAARGKVVDSPRELETLETPAFGWARQSDGEVVAVGTSEELDQRFGPQRSEPGSCRDPSRLPNALGLRGMIRLVVEWCANPVGEYLGGEGATEDPIGGLSARGRAIRGGCYWGDAWLCRAAYRGHFLPVDRGLHLHGFRLLLGPPPPAWVLEDRL